MTSAKTIFKYIDRGKKNLLVLIPGWASDYRIFAPLDLEFNYLIPLSFSPFTFEEALLERLRENKIKKISLFGWSLGGFLGTEIAVKYIDLIDQIILVSVRKRYQKQELDQIRAYLCKNKTGFLNRFYLQCFSKQTEMSWFKQNLLRDYCNNLDLNSLLKSLDYLENTQINPKLLDKIKKIRIIHGEDDRIAPVGEAVEIKNSLTDARFICLKDTGHMPFLKQGFSKVI